MDVPYLSLCDRGAYFGGNYCGIKCVAPVYFKGNERHEKQFILLSIVKFVAEIFGIRSSNSNPA